MPRGKSKQTGTTSVRNSKAFIQVEGLDDFVRDLHLMPQQMKAAERFFEDAAAASVVVRAKDMAYAGSPIAAKSAKDIRAAGRATVVYGGQGYNIGAEFGAYRYRQFERWRGNKEDAGYFYWPAIREFRDEEMLDLWFREVWKVVKPAFPSS